MSNIHLPSNPYGPELVRDGSLLEQVLANEVDMLDTVDRRSG